MTDLITYQDFQKLDIRIAKIKTAECVAGTDKLVRLMVDIGTEEKQLVAGIAETYSVEELVGKQIVVLTNLVPRKLKGLESQGMLLACDGRDGKPVLLTIDKDAESGSRVL